tara:strand:+ start:127 stop:1146 length:1020 start_codon:yes stop_codon:yes gene_type:complete
MGFKYDEPHVGSTTSRKSDLEASDKLKASHLTDLGSAIRQFVNHGIGSYELRDPAPYDFDINNTYGEQGWVDSEHIFKPEFYGSPDPRMTSVSGSTHFRETNSDLSKSALFLNELTGSTWAPVPGLCSRIKLNFESMVYISASFYAYEIGGIATTATRALLDESSQTPRAGHLGAIAAKFQLSINGNRKSGTGRDLHVSTLTPNAPCHGALSSWPFNNEFDLGFSQPSGDTTQDNQLNDGQLFFNMISRQQFSIVFAASLPRGIHDIGIVCKPQENSNSRSFVLAGQSGQDDSYHHMDNYGVEHGDWPTFPRSKQIFIGARNLVIDSYHGTSTNYGDPL